MKHKAVFKILKRIYCFCFFISSSFSFCQTPAASLIKIWNDKNQSDSLRFDAALQLSRYYLYSKADSALYYSKAHFELAETKNSPAQRSLALSTWAATFQVKRKFQEALEYYNRALAIGEEIHNDRCIWTALNNIGSIHNDQFSHSAALQCHQRCLTIAEKIGDKKMLATSLSHMGLTYMFFGDNAVSLDFHTRSLKIKTETGDKRGMAISCANIGTIYSGIGELAQAGTYLKKAMNLFDEINDLNRATSTRMNMGSIFEKSGRYTEALDIYTQSLKTFENLSNKKGIAFSLTNIGSIYSAIGNLEKANEYMTRGAQIFKESGDQKGYAGALNNMAIVWTHQSEGKKVPANVKDTLLKKALSNYLESLQLKETMGDKEGMGTSLANIGTLYLKWNKFPEAIEYYSRALKINEEVNNREEIARDINSIGMAHRLSGNCSKALEFNLKANQLAREAGSPFVVRKSLQSLFLASQCLNDEAGSEKYIYELLDVVNKYVSTNFHVLSEQEKETYFNTFSGDYNSFNAFAAKRKNTRPAIVADVYDLAIQNKGLSLKSSTAMRNSILGSGDTNAIRVYNNWIAQRKKIAGYYSSGKDTRQLDSTANELEKELVKKSQVFNDQAKLGNVKWKDVRKSLKPGEAAIEFIQVDFSDTNDSVIYYALVLKPNSKYPEMIKLIEESVLQKAMGGKSETDESYIRSIYGKKDSANTKLYNLIWKPLQKSVKGAKTIYYSPTGLLHKISFSALNSGAGLYLCDNHRLDLQGSTAKVTLPEKFHVDEKTSLNIFGNIQYDTPETIKDSSEHLTWTYLEGTKSESEKIYGIFKSNNLKVDYINGQVATEEAFKTKASQSNIIHIATHGFFFPDPGANDNEEKTDKGINEQVDSRSGERALGVYNFVLNKNPMMRSGLVFSGANEVWIKKEGGDKEDGVLTAQEVATLDLRKAGLVVLSACETGLGDIKGTEGVYGLQRSLKMAGAKYIIMSLWQVPDAETVEFMESFYSKLVKNKDVRNAFNDTRSEMRKKYDPFYWAAFTLLE